MNTLKKTALLLFITSVIIGCGKKPYMPNETLQTPVTLTCLDTAKNVTECQD